MKFSILLAPLVVLAQALQVSAEECVAPLTCERTVTLDPSPATVKETCTGMECTVPEGDASWFCSSHAGKFLIDYPARVESGTGLPPGKKEDDYAKCIYSKLEYTLSLYNCRDMQHWSCDDCLYAYKYWLCVTTFSKCAASGLPADPTVKPCRGVCNDVVRKCPAALEFTCPLSVELDGGPGADIDYHDYAKDNACAALDLPVSVIDDIVED